MQCRFCSLHMHCLRSNIFTKLCILHIYLYVNLSCCFALVQILGLLLANDNGSTAKYIRKHHLVMLFLFEFLMQGITLSQLRLAKRNTLIYQVQMKFYVWFMVIYSNAVGQWDNYFAIIVSSNRTVILNSTVINFKFWWRWYSWMNIMITLHKELKRERIIKWWDTFSVNTDSILIVDLLLSDNDSTLVVNFKSWNKNSSS